MKSHILLLFCLIIFLGSVEVNGQNFQWARQGGNTINYTNYNNSTTADDYGNVYVTGMFYLSITFSSQTVSSAGHSDIYLAKYNKDASFYGSKKPEAQMMIVPTGW